MEVAYEKIVYWKRNLFLHPTGNANKNCIDKMTRLLNGWISENAIKDIAFKTT